MNKIIAALIAATFSLGAFAQAASAPATNSTQPTASAQDNAAGAKGEKMGEKRAEKKAAKKKAKKAKKTSS